ncbi:ComEA family DNA-binding protein [Algoriphagus mannitolivorans]|uniref:ComEA family DNA-binding protein n=1 Tax=Algoriphagus mannitolivorans TaxID=226504 RepID=UPI0004266648|nr:helix-hairpin-helix domain-containing protein [Algoriphagus mannitolivorans]
MKACLVCLLLFIQSLAFCQRKGSQTIDLESFIERLFPVQEEDLDYESIYEHLFQLYQNPININKADLEILQATYLLSPQQLTSLAEYRKLLGNFLSIYELQAIPDWDLKTIETLLPFITLEDHSQNSKPFLNRVLEAENSYIVFRHKRTWETRKGYTPPDTSSSGKISSRYLGDPNEFYLRYRTQQARDFSIGFTLEKDPGEQFTWDRKTNRYGFNFLSYHFTKYYWKKWKTITVGDFQAGFGQGLVFGAGYTLGKGAETVPTVRRSSFGLLPYTAALEFGFFRGIGITRTLNNWQLTMIFSKAPRDGRISTAFDSLENRQDIITSLSQTGLHRTQSELDTKSKIKELNLGANIQYQSKSSKWLGGANFLATSFSAPLIKPQTTYNQFEFSGKNNQVGSIYLSRNWRNFFFFGESAISKSGGTGTVLGLLSSLSKEVDLSILWRNYSRDFHSFYSSGFSENTRPINEQGLYMGFQYRPSKIWKINLYYDYFHFPWLKYRVYSPSKGTEALGRITYQPRRSLVAFAQIRREEKDRNLSSIFTLTSNYQVHPITKWNGTLSLENQVDKIVFLRSRILWSQVEILDKKTFGFMILQDLQANFQSWRISGRVALFDAVDYDNRLYSFENNVLWTFSIPSFYGRGVRYYLLGQYSFGEKLTAYFRIARTSYTNRKTISSGLQEISGSRQTDSALMIRYWLR